jgi:hypothetical protein
MIVYTIKGVKEFNSVEEALSLKEADFIDSRHEQIPKN